MPDPTLSVVISNYNHAQFLPDALAAILTQSYAATEVIIIDDASTDNSVEIISGFAKQYSSVRLIRNSSNMGVIHNANQLLQLANADYLYSAASDDRVLPGFFEKSMKLLERFPNAAFCFSDPATFEESTGPIRKNHLGLSKEPRYFGPENLVSLLERREFHIAGHTSIIKRHLIADAGGLLPQLRWHCDWFLSWVLAFRYGACYMPEPLATIRVTPQSFAASGRKHRETQIDIVTAMLELLGSRFGDVSLYFRRGAVLSAFRTAALHALWRSKKHRSQITLRLIRRALWNELHRIAAEWTPEPIKGIYRPWNRNSTSSIGILQQSDR